MDKVMWYIYTMEYYSSINKSEIMSFAGKWMELEMVMLSEINQKNNYHAFCCMQTLDLKTNKQKDMNVKRDNLGGSNMRKGDRRELWE
jgi:hypothetical protein